MKNKEVIDWVDINKVLKYNADAVASYHRIMTKSYGCFEGMDWKIAVAKLLRVQAEEIFKELDYVFDTKEGRLFINCPDFIKVKERFLK